MANIYPIKEDLSDIPFAELKVYEALEKLGKKPLFSFPFSTSIALGGLEGS